MGWCSDCRVPSVCRRLRSSELITFPNLQADKENFSSVLGKGVSFCFSSRFSCFVRNHSSLLFHGSRKCSLYGVIYKMVKEIQNASSFVEL